MMKNLLYIAIFISNFIFAQVGVNTETPKVTLDVKGKPTDNTIPDGVLIPRLTGDELKAKDALYTTDQNGTLIYATQPVTVASAKTSLVTSQGMYFYDAIQAKWRKIVTSIPFTVQAFNGQRTVNSSTVVSSGTSRTLDVPTINISPTSDIGSWNSTTRRFTVNRAGVYNISAGTQMYNVDSDGNGAMAINAGVMSFTGGSQRTVNGSIYSINCSATFSGLLNTGDEIYLTANSGNSSWRQGETFLHIIYIEL